MAINRYFSRGTESEQKLYEDLIIESISSYGQDCYYIPREVVETDTIFDDTFLSRFEFAYPIETYIENIEGFEGERDIFTKFGVEIRDAATFIVSRRRFSESIAIYETEQTGPNSKRWYRPREGDLIHLPLSGSTFQITQVEDETPFYQLKNLPTFRMRCELFEYGQEDFDTGHEDIDDMEEWGTFQYILQFDSAGNGFQRNEIITQSFDNYDLTAEVVRWSDSDNRLYVTHFGSSDGKFREFTTTRNIVGSELFTTMTPTSVTERQEIQRQPVDFDLASLEFVDFNENNPFGDPF
jgi:hypothetical protein